MTKLFEQIYHKGWSFKKGGPGNYAAKLFDMGLDKEDALMGNYEGLARDMADNIVSLVQVTS